MFAVLIIFVVVLALFAVMNLANGPGFRRGGRRITIIEHDAPRDRVVEREYDV